MVCSTTESSGACSIHNNKKKAQISSSLFYSETPSLNVFPSMLKTKFQTYTKLYAKSELCTVSHTDRQKMGIQMLLSWMEQEISKFTISSRTFQVPVETTFWWSPVSPAYQQWCTLYILHADKCWWLPGQHHHCQSGSALIHPSSCAQSSPVHSKPVHYKMK